MNSKLAYGKEEENNYLFLKKYIIVLTGNLSKNRI